MDKLAVFLVVQWGRILRASFGGPRISRHHQTRRFMGRSQAVGMTASGLGMTRLRPEELKVLDGRLRYAFRLDYPGKLAREYQTADLTDENIPFGWTSEEGESTRGSNVETQEMEKWHYQDIAFSLAVGLEDARPSEMSALHLAFFRPARPLYAGRQKYLLPGASVTPVEARTADRALEKVPPMAKGAHPPYRIWYPARSPEEVELVVTDRRDYDADVMAGETPIASRLIEV